MAAPIAEPPHLAADLKTLCLSTITAQWRPLAEQATRAASGAGRSPRAAGPSGGDRAPGAPHPTPPVIGHDAIEAVALEPIEVFPDAQIRREDVPEVMQSV